MSADDDESVFPILDRKTPIIDRIKDRREKLQRNSGGNIGQRVAQSALTGQAIDEEFLNNIRSDIANELEIEDNQVSDIFISQVRDALSPSLEDILAEQSTDQSQEETENNSQDEMNTQSDEDTQESTTEDTDSPQFLGDEADEEEDEQTNQML